MPLSRSDRWILGVDLASCVAFLFCARGIAALVARPHPLNLLLFGGGFCFLLYTVWQLKKLRMLEADPDGPHAYIKLPIFLFAFVYALIVAGMLMGVCGWKAYLGEQRVTIITHPWLAPIMLLPLAYPLLLVWALLEAGPGATEQVPERTIIRVELLWTLACDLNLMLLFTYMAARYPVERVSWARLPAFFAIYAFVYGSPRFLMYLFGHSLSRLVSALLAMAWMMWNAVRVV